MDNKGRYSVDIKFTDNSLIHLENANSIFTKSNHIRVIRTDGTIATYPLRNMFYFVSTKNDPDDETSEYAGEEY